MAYKRVTYDEFNIEGRYAYGWEVVTCETVAREARRALREYRDNEPGTEFRITKRRQRIAA